MVALPIFALRFSVIISASYGRSSESKVITRPKNSPPAEAAALDQKALQERNGGQTLCPRSWQRLDLDGLDQVTKSCLHTDVDFGILQRLLAGAKLQHDDVACITDR